MEVEIPEFGKGSPDFANEIKFTSDGWPFAQTLGYFFGGPLFFLFQIPFFSLLGGVMKPIDAWSLIFVVAICFLFMFTGVNFLRTKIQINRSELLFISMLTRKKIKLAEITSFSHFGPSGRSPRYLIVRTRNTKISVSGWIYGEAQQNAIESLLRQRMKAR